jgi:hypothetical protein
LPKNVKIKTYKTIILPLVFYRCGTWSLTLREEHRLRVFENRVLRRIFRPKRDEACHLLARWFAEVFFDPEDGGDTFLRNVGCNSTYYTASYPRR